MLDKNRVVMFYFDSPFFSGAEMQAVRNAQHLVRSGFPVRVCFRESGDLGEKLRDQLVGPGTNFYPWRSGAHRFGVVGRIIRNRLTFIRVFLWAINTLSKQKPAVLHINNGGYPGATGTRAFALASVLFSPKTRRLFSVNNLALDYKQPSRWLQAPIDFVLSKSDINWITASRAAATQLTKVLRLNSSKMHVVPNGISTLVCSCKDDIPTLPLLTDIDTVMACQIGHLEKRKGHRVLIEALSLLREQGQLPPNWLFILEGVGPTWEDLTRHISHAGLAPQVLLIGRANCVLHLLRQSQLLIHPSVSNEDLPNVISEAMSLGIPVIGTDVGGIPEQITNDETGLVVDPGDSKALAEAIDKLMTSQALRSKLGKEGFEKFQAKFSEKPAIQAYMRLYFE